VPARRQAPVERAERAGQEGRQGQRKEGRGRAGVEAAACRLRTGQQHPLCPCKVKQERKGGRKIRCQWKGNTEIKNLVF
jgi:hypothetical protein